MEERILNKLDQIASDIAEIKAMDAVQNEQLKEHIRRSDLLESRVEQEAAKVDKIQEHVLRVDGVFKFLGLLAGAIAVAAAIKEILWP